MEDFFSLFKKKELVINILLIGIVLLSIPLTVQLVQTQKILKSRAASDETIEFTGPNIEERDGKKVAIKPQIALKLVSPFGPPPSSQNVTANKKSFLPNFGLLSEVYGQEDEGEESEGEAGGEDGSPVVLPPEFTPVGEAPDVVEDTCIGEECEQGAELADVSTGGQLSQVPSKNLNYKEVTDINGNEGITLIPPGNNFGEWDLRPAPLRPYYFMPLEELDEEQRASVALWEKSPYNVVWRYTVEPSAENNWAGWGSPPSGYTTRSEIPRTPEGAFMGNALPWPPPGSPDDIGVHNDSLYLSVLTPEEYALYEEGNLTDDDVRRINQQRSDEGMLDDTRYSGVPPVKKSGQTRTSNVSKQSKTPPIVVSPVVGMNPSSGVRCSLQRACQDQLGRTGLQSCASRASSSDQCTQDPTLIQSCGACVVQDLNILPIGSNVGTVTSAESGTTTSYGTTIGYRISEDLSQLTSDNAPFHRIAYAAEDAPLFPYKEPLIINYTFKDTTPGKKFIFVQFVDSNGKKGGCGDNKNRVCIATIELVKNPSGQSSACVIETKALADHNKDKVVNSLDASEQKRLFKEAASKAVKNAKGDLNKDGEINVCDYSLILTSFGAI